MKSIIIGRGEVGLSLYHVLREYDKEVDVLDKHDERIGSSKIYMMHICFGWSDNFEDEVKRYQELYNPEITIVHSTVPPGTCDRLKVCHSPVRGRHPYLQESIKKFVKFVGGTYADEVAEYFRKVQIRTIICRKAITTEIGKILSTNFQYVCVEFTKEAEQLAEKYGVNFNEAFTMFNQTYNEANIEMGHPEYIRPTLVPIQKKVGGHCLEANLELMQSKFGDFMKKLKKNEK